MPRTRFASNDANEKIIFEWFRNVRWRTDCSTVESTQSDLIGLCSTNGLM